MQAGAMYIRPNAGRVAGTTEGLVAASMLKASRSFCQDLDSVSLS